MRSAALGAIPLEDGRLSKLLDSAETRWRGPGSSCPALLQTASDFNLTLPPHSFILFARTAGDS